MKTKLIILITLLLCISASQKSQAQIKVHSDGQITFQHNTKNWYHGIQIFPSGCTHFNTNQTHPWHWVTMASPKHPKGKCWIVNYPDMDDTPELQKNDHRFFVTGEGHVHKRKSLVLADPTFQTGNESIRDPGYILDAITGTYYILIDEIIIQQETVIV